MITEITKQLINWTNDLEELVASEIKANNANPNQAGFTSIADAFAISVYNCLGFSAEYHRGKQKENNNLAEMNHKKAGSAMRFGENEHREKVIADTLIDLQNEWAKLPKEYQSIFIAAAKEAGGNASAFANIIGNFAKANDKVLETQYFMINSSIK